MCCERDNSKLLSVIALIFAAMFVAGCSGESPSAPDGDEAQVTSPVEPSLAANDVATNTGAEVAQEPPGEHPGKSTYDNFCFSCHTPGLSGAPKLGDVEAWAPRIAKGSALLLKATKEGVPPAMPRMGLCMRCTDEELAQAIDYMVVKSR